MGGTPRRLHYADFVVLWPDLLPQVFEKAKSSIPWQGFPPQDRTSTVPVVLWKRRGPQQRGIGAQCKLWQRVVAETPRGRNALWQKRPDTECLFLSRRQHDCRQESPDTAEDAK
ncbi:hypothetical protein BCAL_1202 [Bifidobacterium callitrichos DSM 23973]|uniref:Uncharacterized protein n=1 Tax=Bifidobacterium callitrichos DSM 23973 TaxID=1437609 RepID=A0A086ZY67_9BIFI|nr:hypothetical protein BCAL_1202 [Bifidobacterium callitrichos DSM 23973]